MVEADYRMKLIGIGLEHPPVRQLMSWVDRVESGAVSRNALQRWFFVPNYECVQETADDSGDGIGRRRRETGQCRRSGRGRRHARRTRAPSTAPAARSPKASPSNIRNWPPLRRCTPSFATASIWPLPPRSFRSAIYYGKAGWNMPVFGDESVLRVQTFHRAANGRMHDQRRVARQHADDAHRRRREHSSPQSAGAERTCCTTTTAKSARYTTTRSEKSQARPVVVGLTVGMTNDQAPMTNIRCMQYIHWSLGFGHWSFFLITPLAHRTHSCSWAQF